jgi:hypothetical protein
VPPTITRDEYDSLAQIRNDIIASGMAPTAVGQPFCGWVGSQWDRTRYPTLLYIGKATYEECTLEESERTWTFEELTASYESVLASATASPFWRNFDLVLGELVRHVRIPPPASLREIAAWTNLMKISGSKGNPSGRLAAIQRETSLAILRQEIVRLDPAIVWIVTGNDYAAEVHSVFDETADSETGWVRPEYPFMYRVSDDGRRFVVWTMHPQAKAWTELQRQAGILCPLAARWWEEARTAPRGATRQ